MHVGHGWTTYRLPGVAGILLAAGCVFGTGPNWTWVVQPGVIGANGLALDVVSSPDTVQTAVSFTVIVRTFGSSSCTRPAGADVTVSGLTATVVPLDSVVEGDMVCTSDFRSFPHDASLTFAGPGEARLAVAGRGDHGDTTITYAIVVR
jgi:hypothetical protein